MICLVSEKLTLNHLHRSAQIKLTLRRGKMGGGKDGSPPDGGPIFVYNPKSNFHEAYSLSSQYFDSNLCTQVCHE